MTKHDAMTDEDLKAVDSFIEIDTTAGVYSWRKCTIMLLAEVRRLRASIPALCKCANPYLGTQLVGQPTKCERCGGLVHERPDLSASQRERIGAIAIKGGATYPPSVKAYNLGAESCGKILEILAEPDHPVAVDQTIRSPRDVAIENAARVVLEYYGVGPYWSELESLREALDSKGTP